MAERFPAVTGLDLKKSGSADGVRWGGGVRVEDTAGGVLDVLPPKEKVRPAARNAPASGVLFLDTGSSSDVPGWSTMEGTVDEELKRVDDELSYMRPLELEKSVPPLSLLSGQLIVHYWASHKIWKSRTDSWEAAKHP